MKVLIALDDAPESVHAARAATRLFPGAGFLVINVAEAAVPWIDAGFGFGGVSLLAVDQGWPAADDAARHPDEEAELLRRAQAAGIPHPAPLAAAGDAVTQICRAAEEHDVDVVVVGSHDKTVLRRLFDPSVSAGVIRETRRPVLVVRGPPPSDPSAD